MIINQHTNRYEHKQIYKNATLKAPSFGRRASHITEGLLLASFLSLFGVKSCMNHNEKNISQNVGWENNVRVLASNGQNQKGISINSDSYLKELVDNLKQKETNSIEKSNEILSKKGYNIFLTKFNSLSTPGTKLNIFNKNDKHKNRFVLVVSQDNCPNSSIFKTNAKYFSDEIQKVYDIPKESIINISAKTKENFIAGINSILKKTKKLQDKSEAELLIVYIGHGNSMATKEVEKHYEGAMEGQILSSFKNGKLESVLKETELKQFFKENIKHTKTLFLINACQSGAWIADSGKTTAKKTLQLFA